MTKDKLIEAIREVPIAGKTYEEYVEAVADKLLSLESEANSCGEIIPEGMQICPTCQEISEKTLNYDVFGNLTVPPEPPSKGRKPFRTMQELHGIREGNDTCKTCNHLMNGYYHGRSYYKCKLWIVSHSAATDIRLKNKACNKYESESENGKQAD